MKKTLESIYHKIDILPVHFLKAGLLSAFFASEAIYILENSIEIENKLLKSALYTLNFYQGIHLYSQTQTIKTYIKDLYPNLLEKLKTEDENSQEIFKYYCTHRCDRHMYHKVLKDLGRENEWQQIKKKYGLENDRIRKKLEINEEGKLYDTKEMKRWHMTFSFAYAIHSVFRN